MALSIPIHAIQQFSLDRVVDEPIILLEVTDVTLGDPLYYCSYPVQRLDVNPLQYGVVSNGKTYIFCLTGQLPADREGDVTNTSLVIDNMDQKLTQDFLAITAQNVVKLLIILASAPDTIIREFDKLSIVTVVADEQNLTLSISKNKSIVGNSSYLEPWPAGRQTKDQAPGLHRS